MAESLIIELKLEPTVEKKAFKDLGTKAAAGSKDAGKKAGKAFGSAFGGAVKSNLRSVAREAAVTVAAFIGFRAVKDSLIGATRAAASFEKSIAEINTILPNNGRVTAQLEKELRSLALQFGTSAEAQAKTYYQTVSAGITDQVGATKLLTSANKLAIGGIASVTGAVDILTTVLNAYGRNVVTAKEASDALFTGVRLGKTTVSELSSALGQAIPSAKAAGVGIDLLTASVASLTTKGNTTSIAVTKVKALLTALARNGKELGKGFDITAVKTDGLITVLQRLQKRTGGNSSALLELLGRQEAVQAAQTLGADNAKDLSAAYEEFTRKVGASDSAFKIFQKTASFKFDQARSQIDNLAISMGKLVIPGVLGWLKGFGQLLGTTAGENSKVTEVNKEISLLRKNLNSLMDVRNDAAEGGIFGVTSADEKTVIRTTALIEKLKGQIGELIVKRGELLEKRKEESIVNDEANIKQEVVVEGQEELLNARDIFVSSTADKFDFLSEMMGQTGKRIRIISKEIAAVTFSSIAGGVGKAFQSVGKALASGENAFQAFADGLKSILADIASSIGDVFIKWGIANLVSGNVGMGSAQIAAGAGLKILSGFLGASGGSSSGSTTAPSGASTDPITVEDSGALNSIETRQAEPQTNLTINVEGSFVQQEELGSFITEVLSESGAKNNTFVTDLRVA